MATNDVWEQLISGVWAAAPDMNEADVVRLIDDAVAMRPADDAIAIFESASVRDWSNRPAEAEPLYRRALELGLDDPRHGRAVIQLASTLRNLGRPSEGVTVLQEGFATNTQHPLADAARAFLALCLADSGDERAAVAVALETLAPYLPQYGNSVRAYAQDLAVTPGVGTSAASSPGSQTERSFSSSTQ